MGPIILAKKADPEESVEVNTQRRDSVAKCSRSMQEVQKELGKKNLFSVTVLVTPGSPLIGSAVQDCGIHRLKGVQIVHRVFRHGAGSDEVPVTGSVVQLEESLAQWQLNRASIASSSPESDDVEAAQS